MCVITSFGFLLYFIPSVVKVEINALFIFNLELYPSDFFSSLLSKSPSPLNISPLLNFSKNTPLNSLLISGELFIFSSRDLSLSSRSLLGVNDLSFLGEISFFIKLSIPTSLPSINRSVGRLSATSAQPLRWYFVRISRRRERWYHCLSCRHESSPFQIPASRRS